MNQLIFSVLTSLVADSWWIEGVEWLWNFVSCSDTNCNVLYLHCAGYLLNYFELLQCFRLPENTMWSVAFLQAHHNNVLIVGFDRRYVKKLTLLGISLDYKKGVRRVPHRPLILLMNVDPRCFFVICDFVCSFYRCLGDMVPLDLEAWSTTVQEIHPWRTTKWASERGWQY